LHRLIERVTCYGKLLEFERGILLKEGVLKRKKDDPPRRRG
jgi:hypothetical protein